MGNAAAIIATLELTRGKFKTEIEATESDLKKVQGTVQQTAAAVSVLERELQKDSGNKALKENLSTLKTSLRDAGKEMKLLEQQKRRLDAAMGESPQPPASGSGIKANRGELMHSGRAIVDMISAGQSPLQALLVEAPRIVQGLGVSLGSLAKFAGPLAAAAGIYEVGKALVQAHREAVKLNEELEKSGRPSSSMGGAVAGNIAKQLESSRDQIERYQKGVDSPIGNAFSNFTEGAFRLATPLLGKLASAANHVLPASMNARGLVPDRGQTREEALGIAQEQQRVEYARLVAAETRDNVVSEKAAAQGKDAAAPDEIEREFRQKKDEIEQMVAANPIIGDTGLIVALRAEYDLRKKIAEVQHEQIDSQYALAHAQTQIKIGDDPENFGSDVHTKAVDAARAAVEARRVELANVEKNGLDPREAKKNLDAAISSQYDVVHAAVEELNARKAVTEELRLQAQGMTAEANRLAVIASFEERIAKAKRLGDTDAVSDLEKQKGPALDIADLAVEESKIAIRERGIRIGARGVRGARAQHSPDDLIKQGEDLIALAEERKTLYDNLAAKNGGKLGQKEQAESDANDERLEGLQKSVEGIKKRAAQELADARAQTEVMQLQITGQTNAAQLASIRGQYEDKIKKALDDQNFALADQFRLQEKMAVQAAQLAEFRKTPMQHAQDRLTQQKDEQDLKQMAIRQRQELESARLNYEDKNRATLPVDQKKRAEAIAKAVPDLNGVLGKMADTTAAKDAAGNASDAAFNARFHPNNVQPDRRPVATVDPQQQHSQDDSNIGDAVDVLEDIRKILDDRLDLTIQL